MKKKSILKKNCLLIIFHEPILPIILTEYT